MRVTHILCPIDFSGISRHAFDHAAAIAERDHARLTLLHVAVNRPAMDLPPLVLDDAERARVVAGLERMAAVVAKDVPVAVRVEEASSVHEEILAQIAALHADLLVLGTHGRSGFHRLFLGSVTEKVIRQAMCPMLVVPPRAPDIAPDAPVRFRRILCPVDFSQASLEALTRALDIAREARAQLTMLHVIEIPPELRQHYQLTADFDIERVHAAAAAASLRRLRELVPASGEMVPPVETIVREGAAPRQIVNVAVEQSSDLIVMGTYGHSIVDRMVFGSTSHQVIRAATCPVLVAGRS
jgi:nucleotide-binding universal stress UspA family protein